MPVLAYEVMTKSDHAQVLRPARSMWELVNDGRVWRVSRQEFPGNPTIQQVRSRLTTYASYHRLKVRVQIENNDSLILEFVGRADQLWRGGAENE